MTISSRECRMAIETKTSIAALLCGASVLAMGAAPAIAQQAQAYADRLEAQGAYLTGDKHNHTTCSDGTTSVRTLVDQSVVVYGLDWFAQTGHGGSGNRDCRFDDIQTGNVQPLTNLGTSNPREFWEDTIGRDALKGRDIGANMWRWQSIYEYAYPDVAHAGKLADKPTWIGIETNAPGHEHVSMGIIGNQFRKVGDAYATAQFEYLWDRADSDDSGGESLDFENPANRGVAKLPNVTGDHSKSVKSVEWLRKHYPTDSYYVPAHVERQGAYTPGENRGYNVEDLRDYHNAGLFNPNDVTSPSLAFGGEMQAGHQAAAQRGTYSAGRPTVGLGTFGGSGCYGAAEMSLPGTAPDGTPLTRELVNEIADAFEAEFAGVPDVGGFNRNASLPRYVFCKPGVKTLWDAMLSEGRRYFIFGSSDWHNRGAFGPFEPHSTLDFWPGEYQKIYAYTRGVSGRYDLRTARAVVAGMRSGNTYSVMGDLIGQFNWVMCQGGKCATMGQELVVNPAGADVEWFIRIEDPSGVNNSPYAFSNPYLLPLGLEVPMNAPMLDNIDIIRGDVTGPIDPSDPAYKTSVSHPSTEIWMTMSRDEFSAEGDFLIASGSIPAESFDTDMYFRMRGTNLPKGTPNGTDADGNPLSDNNAGRVVCPFPYTGEPGSNGRNSFDPMACPLYLPTNAEGEQVLSFDVEAWANLWFHANPIFVKVSPTQQAALR